MLKAPVDAFFDTVMVMAEEDDLRHNRLALLRDLRDAMNRVADISKLGAMKLVILDRDGTINHDSDEYIKSPEEWKPIQGSLEAIARLTQAGYRIVVATNQSGIARGLFDTRDAERDPRHAAPRAGAGRRPHRRVLLLPARRGRRLRVPQAAARHAARDRAALQRAAGRSDDGRRRAARPRGRGGGRREAGAGADRQGREDARRGRAAAGHAGVPRPGRRSPSTSRRDRACARRCSRSHCCWSRRPTRCSRFSPFRCRA